MEPPVSVAVAPGHIRAAIAAALPPELPPGTRLRSQGFLTAPKYDVSFDEPIANSSILVLPKLTAPASLNFLTTVASYGATKLWSILEPHVVSQSSAQKISFCAIGIPVNTSPSPL